MKPTIKDVAKMAEVSISTVSRVLNSPEKVAESKRKKVLQAIEKLQYQPNALARGLILGKTKTFSVMIPEIKNLYFSELLRGMEDAAKQSGYSLMICNTNRDNKRLISYLEMFSEKRVDGILFASEPVYPDYYEAFKTLNIPVVLASTHSMEYDLPSVKINDEQAAFDAVSYLIGLGHKKIGMISLPLSDPIAGLPRYQGFMRALRTHGLEVRDDYFDIANRWYEDAYDATARLFSRHPDLTAVFASSDEFALGAISYLHENGFRVPQHVSVMGFDNIRVSQMTIPKLSTVAQPLYEIGVRAVQKIRRIVEGEDEGETREIVPHHIVIRNSTAPVYVQNTREF